MNWDLLNAVLFMAIASLAIACAAMTVAKEAVFDGFRTWCRRRLALIASFFESPYAVSHVLAIGVAVLYRPLRMSDWIVADIAVTALAMTGAAAYLCGMLYRAFYGIRHDELAAVSAPPSTDTHPRLRLNRAATVPEEEEEVVVIPPPAPVRHTEPVAIPPVPVPKPEPVVIPPVLVPKPEPVEIPPVPAPASAPAEKSESALEIEEHGGALMITPKTAADMKLVVEQHGDMLIVKVAKKE